MINKKIVLLVLLAIISTSNLSYADYYSDSKSGWWWYERPPQEEEAEPEAKKPVPPKTEKAEKGKKERKYPSLKTTPYEVIWNMDPEDYRETWEGFRSKAVRVPTEENVKEFWTVNEIARKKAAAFTSSSQYVWQKYPELTVSADEPTSSPGRMTRIATSTNERTSSLQKEKDNYALIVFNKPGCPFCAEEAKILKWFTQITGWTVKPVDISQNPAMARRFMVTITPSIIIVQRGTQEFMPVSAGVSSVDEIEEAAYRAIRALKGDTKPDNFDMYDFQKGGAFDPDHQPH